MRPSTSVLIHRARVIGGRLAAPIALALSLSIGPTSAEADSEGRWSVMTAPADRSSSASAARKVFIVYEKYASRLPMFYALVGPTGGADESVVPALERLTHGNYGVLERIPGAIDKGFYEFRGDRSAQSTLYLIAAEPGTLAGTNSQIKLSRARIAPKLMTKRGGTIGTGPLGELATLVKPRSCDTRSGVHLCTFRLD